MVNNNNPIATEAQNNSMVQRAQSKEKWVRVYRERGWETYRVCWIIVNYNTTKEETKIGRRKTY